MLNSLFNRWTVLIPTLDNLAIFLILIPFRSNRSTSAYSSFFCSVVLQLPSLRPNLPPFSMNCLRPDCNLKAIFSRSNYAQVLNVASIMAANGDGLPLSCSNVNFSFCRYKLILLSIRNFIVSSTLKVLRPILDNSLDNK